MEGHESSDWNSYYADTQEADLRWRLGSRLAWMEEEMEGPQKAAPEPGV